MSLVRAAALLDRLDADIALPQASLRSEHVPPPLPAVKLQLPPRGAPEWQGRLVRRIVVSDIVASTIAGAVPLMLRFEDSAITTPYAVMALLVPVIWILACAFTRSYEPRFLGTGSEEYRRVADAGVRLVAAGAVASLAFRVEVARPFVIMAFPLAVVLTLMGRYAVRQHLHRARARGHCLHRVIVIGRERSAAEMVRRLRREPYAGFSVVGLCVDRPQSSLIEGIPVVGTSSTVVEALELTGADTVAVGAWSDLSQADLRRLSWKLEGSGVSLVVAPSLTDVAGPRIHIRPVAGLPLLHVEEPEFGGGRRLLKSAFDRCAAGLGLLVFLPLLLVVGAAIRMDSRGPALFRQTRVGIDGEPFTMYKFRSMFTDAEERLASLQQVNVHRDGPLFKVRDDPRVTRLGRLLRQSSLDEMPQLWNVLKGDMSLVGPRPPLPREVDEYGNEAHRRLLVKPGVTGLWQVSGRSGLTWDESVRLDLHYVESWSIALDLMILWKTIFAVVRRDGAY